MSALAESGNARAAPASAAVFETLSARVDGLVIYFLRDRDIKIGRLRECTSKVTRFAIRYPTLVPIPTVPSRPPVPRARHLARRSSRTTWGFAGISRARLNHARD